MLIGLYEEGASDVEVCKALKITYNEFDKKTRSDELFGQLVDYGRLAAKSWWLELGRLAAKGGNKANFNFWYSVMKNRYGWADKVENVGEGDKPMDQMSQDEILAEIARKKHTLAKLMKNQNVLLAGLANESDTSN